MSEPPSPWAHFLGLLMLIGITRYLGHLWRLFQGERESDELERLRPITSAASELPPDDPLTSDDPARRAARLEASLAVLNEEYAAIQTLDELLERPRVQSIVEWMGSPAFGAEDLFGIYSGQNLLLACVATRALALRADGASVADRVRATMSRYHTWTRVLALRLLDTHVPPPKPLIGPILASIDETWNSDEALSLLTSFARSRAARGEWLTFDGTLNGAASSRLAIIKPYVERMGEVAEPLRVELRDVGAMLLDEEFLRSFGRVWPREREAGLAPIVEHAALAAEAEAIEQALAADPPRSVLLVGAQGVGKTSLARVVLERLQRRGWTVFEAAPEELNADQKWIGALEGRVQQLVREIDRKKRVVWLVRDFPSLAWTGISMHTPTSAIDMVLPVIERGDIVVLGTAEPAAHERMLLAKPRVRTALEERRLTPLDREATLALVGDWLATERARGAAPEAPEAVLREAWNLTRQYVAEAAPPGNLFRLVHGALRRRPREAMGEGAPPLGAAELVAALSAMTGLPATLLDERERLDLAALRGHFEEQVVGQPEAIDCLVERLAMVKAGVTDPRRPLGVFLFVGPTGTGKTELAKALASFVFGDAARMIRLDMSELANPDAIGRIVGEPNAPAGHQALVDQVRMQPFSLLLLDEFEKSHPAVWDLFLQVFDDGRLTDRRGRTADFRHAIIIMTSNLGGQIPAGSTVGFTDDSGRFSAASVERAVARAFRKEFLNRIDRVVVFRPLTRETMREVLKKQLRESFLRRGLRNRQWAVEWDDAALDFLLERGFTVDLGARPLQRAIERYVLAPLAKTIVDHEIPQGDQFLFVHRERDGLSVEFVDPDAPLPAAAPGPAVAGAAAGGPAPDGHDLDALAARLAALEARVRGTAWRDAQRGELELTGLDAFWSAPDRFAILDRIEYRDRIGHALQSAQSLLGRLRGSSGAARGRGPAPQVERLAQRLHLLETACDDVEQERPHDAFLSVESTSDAGRRPPSEAVAFSRRLGEMYRRWADRRGMRLAELDRSPDGAAGFRLVLSVSGLGAHALLAPEDGWHLFEVPSGKGHEFDRWQTRVRVVAQPPEPPHAAGIDLGEQARRALAAASSVTGTIVRHYREQPSPLVRDHVRGYRTGRLDLVEGGDFDRIAAGEGD
jgi:ATP-dependent Clp protease ATP-binding subunit ClpC